MPRPRYQIADADVAAVHRWVQSKFRETAPLDTPTTEQLQQWCDRFLDAAQWKQLHAVIRAARRDASHQTRTVQTWPTHPFHWCGNKWILFPHSISGTPKLLMHILCLRQSGWQRQSPAFLKAD